MKSNNQERLIEDRLDAALKHYGAAEPRPGLESRILANLRSAQGQSAARTWRWWPVLMAVASVVLIVTALRLEIRPHPSTSPLAVEHHSSVPEAKEGPEAHASVAQVTLAARPHRRETHAVASAPRLEQFPSPQPLSEQEELLAGYIEQFPHEAALMARAQTQLMKQEMIDRELPPEDAVLTDSQQENR